MFLALIRKYDEVNENWALPIWNEATREVEGEKLIPSLREIDQMILNKYN